MKAKQFSLFLCFLPFLKQSQNSKTIANAVIESLLRQYVPLPLKFVLKIVQIWGILRGT
jgi:hypothetical protein